MYLEFYRDNKEIIIPTSNFNNVENGLNECKRILNDNKTKDPFTNIVVWIKIKDDPIIESFKSTLGYISKLIKKEYEPTLNVLEYTEEKGIRCPFFAINKEWATVFISIAFYLEKVNFLSKKYKKFFSYLGKEKFDNSEKLARTLRFFKRIIPHEYDHNIDKTIHKFIGSGYKWDDTINAEDWSIPVVYSFAKALEIVGL